MNEEAKKRIQETLRRVLRQTTLRAILRPLGRTPLDVSKTEEVQLLEPYEQAIEADYVMCCEVADQLVALSHAGDDLRAETAAALESEQLTLDTDD